MLFGTAAMVFDLKTYHIPNRLIVSGLFMGAGWQAGRLGLQGMGMFAVGILLPALLLPLWKSGVLGGGDIKLFSVIGGLLGGKAIIYCMFYSFLAGGALACILLICRRNLKLRLKLVLNYIFSVIQTGIWYPYYNIKEKGHASTMHFSVAICLGTAVYLLL